MTTPAMTDQDRERALFEAAYDANEFRREYDKYGPTEAAWAIWQAARSALPQQVVAVGSIDTAELRKLALAATPGPWVDNRNLGWVFPQTQVEAPDIGLKVAVLRNGELDVSCTIGKAELEWANAAYIAAANPKAILALLDALDARQPAPVKPEGQSVRDQALEDAAEAALYMTEVPGDLMGSPCPEMQRIANRGIRIAQAIRALKVPKGCGHG